MSKNIIIKGGAVTKLEEISKMGDMLDRVIKQVENKGNNHHVVIDNTETVALAAALTSYGDVLSTVDASHSSINVSNCTFTGLETGLSISTGEPNIEEDVDSVSEEIDTEEYDECLENRTITSTTDYEQTIKRDVTKILNSNIRNMISCLEPHICTVIRDLEKCIYEIKKSDLYSTDVAKKIVDELLKPINDVILELNEINSSGILINSVSVYGERVIPLLKNILEIYKV